MNKHAKLGIIAKIEQLPAGQQGTVARLFETIAQVDWATKMPYIIGLWLGLAGLIIFPAVYDLDNLDSVDSYLIGVIVAAVCFFAGTLATRLFYFGFRRNKAVRELDYLLSLNDENRLALRTLRGLDPALRFIIDKIMRRPR